jgi:Na+/H+-dicarboxylate symporter
MEDSKAKNERRAIKLKNALKENKMLILAILAVFIGYLSGLILRDNQLSFTTKKYFLFPGEIFLRMFKFVLLPLIASSLITGIGSLDFDNTNKRIIYKSLAYFCFTTILASFLGISIINTFISFYTYLNNKGILLAIIIKPGSRFNSNQNTDTSLDINIINSIFDLFRSIFYFNYIYILLNLSIFKELISRLNIFRNYSNKLY